ncbi:MAG: hypothetical protein IJT98_06635 [Prevotella sp.]|nr:hypothetical protein [Prevotella sp.]
MEQNVGYQQPAKQGNAMGLTGFILAIIGVVLVWIPILHWIAWLLGLLGLIFSIIGMTKKAPAPKGLAITGLILSVVIFIVYYFINPIIWESAAEAAAGSLLEGM